VVNFQVEKLSASIPLAMMTCGHGRQMGYNLYEGLAAHTDDGSTCRQTGLPGGVDEELTSRDRLSEAVMSLLTDASARLDAMVFQGGNPQ
jgi:hypothetical protein